MFLFKYRGKDFVIMLRLQGYKGAKLKNDYRPYCFSKTRHMFVLNDKFKYRFRNISSEGSYR